MISAACRANLSKGRKKLVAAKWTKDHDTFFRKMLRALGRNIVCSTLLVRRGLTTAAEAPSASPADVLPVKKRSNKTAEGGADKDIRPYNKQLRGKCLLLFSPVTAGQLKFVYSPHRFNCWRSASSCQRSIQQTES